MERHSRVINRLNFPRAYLSRGFTLAECLIASVVLTVGVLGVSGALSAASTQTQSMDVDARSLSIARTLMEEIASRPFDTDPNEQSTGVPTCISDYNNVTRTISAVASDATSVADTITFTSRVTVQYRQQPAGPAVNGGDLALITVTTTPSAKGGGVTLHRLAVRYTQLRS